MKNRVLIAEDDHFYRFALAGVLRGWGYDVTEARNGNEAWDVLQAPEAPKIAILDWMMPGIDGLELCRRVRSLSRPEPTYLIILTSMEGKENAVIALQQGADDIMRKPFDQGELQARLKVGERIVGLQTSQAVIFTLARAVEAKSPYTQGHADRVTFYALALASALGLSLAEKETLRRGGILHDVGKISIPDAILNKPAALTPEEYDVIKRHPTLGEEIVRPLLTLSDTLPLIRWHHERMDGTGYPDRLPGKDIPFLVRILSIADVYDALRSERPYRPSLPHEQCLRILRQDAEKGGVDGELLRTFCAMPESTFSATKSAPHDLQITPVDFPVFQDCA